MDEITTWRNVELGNYNRGEEYIQSIVNQGQHVGRVAREFIPKVPLESNSTTIDLVKIASYSLDLSNQNASITEICEEAFEKGLRLCQPEVALALREQYPDQKKNEILWIATERLETNNEFGYFSISHENRGRWLTLGCGGPSCWWGKWRRKLLKPKQQEKLVSMDLCECPWSRQKNPVYLVFEQNF